MSFVVVEGELCSCSCNFVSVMIENKGKNDKFQGNQGKKVIINFGVQLYFCTCTTGLAWARAEIEKFSRISPND